MEFLSGPSVVRLGHASAIDVQACRYDLGVYRDSLFASTGIAMPAALADAVAQRKAEYLAGRLLSQRLLRARACDDGVGFGPQHEPLWPARWVGSISHCGGRVICAVAARTRCAALGIDIERWMDDGRAERIRHMVVDEVEWGALKDTTPLGVGVTLLFSMKESFLKAALPRATQPVGFESARIIHVDAAQGSFVLRVENDLSADVRAGERIQGRFLLGEHHVITLIGLMRT